jgi:hypothetical protein
MVSTLLQRDSLVLNLFITCRESMAQKELKLYHDLPVVPSMVRSVEKELLIDNWKILYNSIDI